MADVNPWLQRYIDAQKTRDELAARQAQGPALPSPERAPSIPLVTANPNYRPETFNAQALYPQTQVQAPASPSVQAPAQAPAASTREQAIAGVQSLLSSEAGKGTPDAQGVRRYTERMIATSPNSFSVQRASATGAPVALGEVINQTSPVAGLPSAAEMFNSQQAPAQEPTQQGSRPVTMIRAGRVSTEGGPSNPLMDRFLQFRSQLPDREALTAAVAGNQSQLASEKLDIARQNAATAAKRTEAFFQPKPPSAMDALKIDYARGLAAERDAVLNSPRATAEQKLAAQARFQQLIAPLLVNKAPDALSLRLPSMQPSLFDDTE